MSQPGTSQPPPPPGRVTQSANKGPRAAVVRLLDVTQVALCGRDARRPGAVTLRQLGAGQKRSPGDLSLSGVYVDHFADSGAFQSTLPTRVGRAAGCPSQMPSTAESRRDLPAYSYLYCGIIFALVGRNTPAGSSAGRIRPARLLPRPWRGPPNLSRPRGPLNGTASPCRPSESARRPQPPLLRRPAAAAAPTRSSGPDPGPDSA
jgi:hypothetical protein